MYIESELRRVPDKRILQFPETITEGIQIKSRDH